jgi:hypothetical protein
MNRVTSSDTEVYDKVLSFAPHNRDQLTLSQRIRRTQSRYWFA